MEHVDMKSSLDSKLQICFICQNSLKKPRYRRQNNSDNLEPLCKLLEKAYSFSKRTVSSPPLNLSCKSASSLSLSSSTDLVSFSSFSMFDFSVCNSSKRSPVVDLYRSREVISSFRPRFSSSRRLSETPPVGVLCVLAFSGFSRYQTDF